MNSLKARVVARCIPLIAGAFALTNCLACNNGDGYIVAIPGTEAVTRQGSAWNISVSPDERWLAFWELSRGFEHPYDAHLCTLDLVTSTKTTHDIDSVHDRMSSFSHVEPWRKIALDFQDACWADGRCYVAMFLGHVWRSLVFVPGAPGAKWSPVPREVGCSDCPPPRRVESTVVDLVGRWLLSFGRLYSVAYKEGQLDRHLYHVDDDYEGARILRTDSTGSETVIQHPRRRFKNTDIYNLRISPNERYLAYGLFLKLRSPIPLPDQKIELHVYDLAEEKDHTISSGYRYISNLIWSPDSKRLYFAGFQGEKRAVYRVDVDEALEE